MIRLTFIVHDKPVADVLHAIAGRAYNLDVVPVANAAPAASGSGNGNGKLRQKAANRLEQLQQAFAETNATVIDAEFVREWCRKCGLGDASASYWLHKAQGAKLIKKTKGTTGSGTTYDVVR